MDQRQQLQRLFMFDLWCARKLTDLLNNNDNFEDKAACSAFLSHIVNAQRIWFYRVVRLDIDDTMPWDEYLLTEIKKEAKSANQFWIDLIGDHEMDLDTVIHYQNNTGNSFQNRVVDICHHLIIHGQHHRAQISLLLRRAGITPPPTDYIHYLRSSAGKSN